ncbi:MAG: hypothetical protein Q8L55_03680 [Phycisphaerales bacterium]|nr:hypothetical protein [Phycisphaerales bacterium]
MSASIIPSNDTDFRDWMNEHSEVFATAPTSIGLTAALATAFTAQVATMNQTWDDLFKAKQAYETARDEWKNVKAQTRTVGNGNVIRIKAFAALSTNPSAVYIAAQIPAPKPHTPNQQPGQCTNVKANLNTVNGNLKLTWKCANPGSTNGTVYTIERRVGTTGAWTPLGLSSVKSFTDLTLPASAVVQYNITATRSGLVGTPSGPVSVVFGHAGNGETFIASITTETPAAKKMAA